MHRSKSKAARRSGFTRLLVTAVRSTYQADRRGFLVTGAFQVVAALAPTALVLIGQYLLKSLVVSGHQKLTFAHVLPPVVALAVVTALVTATTALQQQQQRVLAERSGAQTWERVLDVTGRVRLEMYETPKFYDQLQRIKNNAITQPLTVTTSVFGLFGSLIGTGGLMVVVLTIAPILVPLMLVAGVPALLVSRRASSIEFAFLTRAMPLYRARQYLRDVLTGRDEAKEVRVFGTADALRERHNARRKAFEDALARHARRRTLYGLVTVAVSSVFLILTLGIVVYLLTSHQIPLSSAAAAVLAVRFLATGLDQLFRSVGGLLEASTYLADLDDFVNRPRPGYASGAVVGPLQSSIRLDSVNFAYPGSGREVLHDVSMEVGAGEIIALVGENGSGKTTLAKLIAGLYTPTGGHIAWDGRDYTTLDLRGVHRHVAVIFQDFVRYQLSALDNIGLGQPDEADNEDAARDAAKRANALDFLENLPSGLHTTLSREFEKGTDLSGGQWQRVALARALRKAASLIVLDEPSASLDPRAEAELFGDIRSVLRGRSALLISHRFSSVRLADRIYVLRDGRVIEHGDHDELMSAAGLYAELFALQADAYH